MKVATILGLKFIVSLVAFAVGLDLFFDASITEILSFAVLITAVTYLIGERMLLERLGNKHTVLLDFLVTYVSVWVFGNIVLENYLQIAWGSIISAAILASAEIFLHRFALRGAETAGTTSENQRNSPRMAYGMELAQENDPVKRGDNNG